jgi:hypothetical protein
MTFGSELKSSASNLGQAIWPSPSRSKIFLESIGRGVSWALVLLFLLALPILAISLNSENLGFSLSADDFARSLVILAVAASGSFIQLVINGTAFDNGNFYLDITSSPSLITLLVGFLAYRAGTKVKEFRNGTDTVRQLAGFSSLGLGLGFAGSLYFATVIASGSLTLFGGIELASMSLTGFLWAFFVVSLPAWLGSLRSGNRKVASKWKWAYSAIRTFGLFYLTLLGIVAAVYLIYLWITPDFALSLPEVEPTATPSLNGWLVLTGVVAFLLFLPTFVFNLFAVAIGAEYALRVNLPGFDLLSLLDAIPFVDGASLASSLGSVSILSTLGIWAFVVVMAAVIFSSLISGLASTGKASFDVVFRRDIVAGLTAVFLVGFILRSITQFSGFLTNRGVALEEATEGSLTLQEGFLTIGITTASFAFILALIALFMVFGASTASGFIQESFPRLTSWFSARTLEANIDRGIFALIFGRFVAVLASLAIVLPLGVALIERVWATADGPINKFRDVQSLVESGDLEQVKEFFTGSANKDAKWLPDDVLLAARPSADARNPIDVTNSWNDPWRTGQLDAYGEVSWKTDSGAVVLNLGTDSEVAAHLRFIHNAKYTATADRLNLNVSYGKFLSEAGLKDLSVNGVMVPAGTYDAIPGTYSVKAPGFKLVAPSETLFVTNGNDMAFSAKEEPLVPSAASSILNKEIDRLAQQCGSFTTLNTPRCFTFEEIFQARKPIGTPPAEDYFAIKTGDFKVLETSCSGSANDKLLSAASVARTKTCTTEMTFEVTYFESKIQVSDVFQTQTFNACPGLSIPCNRSRQVKVGTRETEVIGDRIGRGTMSSSVGFEVRALGTLRDNGTFEIIDRFVPPVYEIEEPVVEQPVTAEPLKILGYYKDIDALRRANPSGQLGDGYVVSPGLQLYVWDGRDWTLVGRR